MPTTRLSDLIETTEGENSVGATASSGKVSVLAIDDEKTIRELLTSILARFGHDVTSAPDGMSGIQAFRTGKYDIVFTDLGMPEMSGWEVARRIKAIDPSAKVVMLTGWGVELDESELKEKKIDSVVSKPFQIHHLIEVLSKVSKK